MTVTEVEAPLYLPPPRTPRTPGVHNSSIIRRIAIDQGILTAEQEEDLSLLSDSREITDPVALLRISIGLAWEEYYIPTILGPAMEVVDHPGEIEADGVYMTPDGESVSVIVTVTGKTTLDTVIHEVKATYKSTKTVGMLQKQWMWLAQIKSYCRAKMTRHAVLHVLFLCGDYSYPMRPQIKAFQIEFDQDELDSNWELLMDYKGMYAPA